MKTDLSIIDIPSRINGTKKILQDSFSYTVEYNSGQRTIRQTRKSKNRGLGVLPSDYLSSYIGIGYRACLRVRDSLGFLACSTVFIEIYCTNTPKIFTLIMQDSRVQRIRCLPINSFYFDVL